MIALPFHRNPLHRPLHPADDGLRRKHATRSVAGLAGLRHALQVALPHALPSHLDEPKLAHRKRLCARAVATQVGPELLEHPIATLLRLHVDEIADDDAADVAQPQLPSDLARGL